MNSNPMILFIIIDFKNHLILSPSVCFYEMKNHDPGEQNHYNKALNQNRL